MKYKVAIFDLDGTILDTLDDLADSINHSLVVCGFPERTRAEVRAFVGGGLRKLCVKAVPEGSKEEDVDNVLKEMMSWYGSHCSIKTAPYEGIMDMLAAVKDAGVKVAVVSNKADFAVKKLCDQYFPGVFPITVGEKPTVRKKPAPDSVNEVLRLLGEVKENAVYIGDSEVDVRTAENAEMDQIICNWGFRDENQLVAAGAKVLVRSVEEMRKAIIGE